MRPLPDPGRKAEFFAHPHIRTPGTGPSDGDLHSVRGVEIDSEIREPIRGAAIPGGEAQRVAFGPFLQQYVVAAEVRVHALRARNPPHLDAAGVVCPRKLQRAEVIDDPGFFLRDAFEHRPDLRDGEIGPSLVADCQGELSVRRGINHLAFPRAGIFLRGSPVRGGKGLPVIGKRNRISVPDIVGDHRIPGKGKGNG